VNDKHAPDTPLTRRLVRAVLGFGVGVAIGLAPYLGTVAVPGFRPLLELYPLSIRDTMIPLAAALMGIVAVCVEWYGSDRLSAAWLSRSFRRALTIVVAGLLLVVVVHTTFVVKVVIDGGRETVSFVVGWSRQPSCKCGPELSDAQCITDVTTFNPASIDTCWGDRNVRFAKLSLILSYLVFTGGFGGLVGLATLRAGRRRRLDLRSDSTEDKSRRRPNEEQVRPEAERAPVRVDIAPLEVPPPPADLVDAIRGRDCVVILGSGMNAQAGLPSWSSLLDRIIHDALEPIEVAAFEQLLETRLVDDVVAALVAQLSAGELKSRIIEEIRKYEPIDLGAYRTLSKLPVSAVVSLNLDHLALDAFSVNAHELYTPRHSERLLDALSRNEFFVLMLNGSFDSPESILLSYQDLKDTMSRNQAFRDLIRRLYYSRPLLFLGVSLNGVENFLRTVDRTAEPSRTHYALVEVTDPTWELVSRNLEATFRLKVLPFTPHHRRGSIDGFLRQIQSRLDTSVAPAPQPVPQGVSRVELRNIGPFIHCDLEFDERWTVILGDNGVGKSSLLRAIAVGLCGKATEPFATRLLKSGAGTGEIKIWFGGREYLTTVSRRSGDASAVVDTQSGVAIERERVLVVGYPALRTVGGARASADAPPQRPNPADLIPLTSEEPDPRLDSIKTWIVRIHNAKNSEDTPATERQRYAALYDRIFSLLRTLTAGVALEPAGVNALTGQITIRTVDGVVPFESLSQGTLSLIGWTGALMQRMYETAPQGIDDPLKAPAVVLVDEIDAHMHPAWQQALVKRLSETFRNTQFIVTTHSPLVIGSLEPNQVYRFERNQEGAVEIARPEYALKGLGASGLLTSGLFGLASQLDLETANALDRKRRLTARRLDPATPKEEFSAIDVDLRELEAQVAHVDATKIVRDPLYAPFVEAMTRVQHTSSDEGPPITLTADEKQEQAKVAEAIVRDLMSKPEV
jgi:hypothetical protein